MYVLSKRLKVSHHNIILLSSISLETDSRKNNRNENLFGHRKPATRSLNLPAYDIFSVPENCVNAANYITYCKHGQELQNTELLLFTTIKIEKVLSHIM